MTDVTSPERDPSGPVIHSPTPTPIKKVIQVLKQEEDETGSSSEASMPTSQDANMKIKTLSETRSIAMAKSQPMPVSDSPPPSIPSPPTDRMIDMIGTLAPRLVSTSPVARSDEDTANSTVDHNGSRRASLSSTKRRVPGDYTLTAVLLSEPETAWIFCTVCNTAFVQRDAYYTRSSCPRCERHSKLYGYIWPKTEKEGPRDTEERVLDHRTVHRFLGADDEARIRGRKAPSWLKDEPPAPARVAAIKRAVSKKRKPSPASATPEPSQDLIDAFAGFVRRSSRVRRASAKAAAMS